LLTLTIVTLVSVLDTNCVGAADVTISPAVGSGFVVRNATNTTDRFRINEDGTVLVPALAGGPQQPGPVCFGASGTLGPCAPATSGSSYAAGTGLNLSGTTFSVAQSFQLPQTCTSTQIAQWNGSTWACAAIPSSGGFVLPYAATQATNGALFDLTNSDAGTPSSVGDTATLRGTVSGGKYHAGLSGVDISTSGGYGVFGKSNSGIGVYGLSPTGVGVSAGTDSATALFAYANGPGIGLFASSANGTAANFTVANSSNTANAVIVNNAGTGQAVTVNQTNTASGASVLLVNNAGLGRAAEILATNASNTTPALLVNNAGTGQAVTVNQTNAASGGPVLLLNNAGLGGAAEILATNASNTTPALLVIDAGSDGAVQGQANGSGSGVVGVSSAGGAGIKGYANGAGNAGFFKTATVTTGDALYVLNEGSGAGLHIVHNGSSTPDYAVFGGLFSNSARIDVTGKGFFNGGTQTGGADVAELIRTSGTEPKPGDVVEIDPDHSDRFRLCAEANSIAVAGVISTKPGVTLNDATGADHAASGPALALAGRVPVKVTNENGPIHVRDLLVASNLPGHAMRAPANPVPGTVIGKALESFDAMDGSIKMLVWLH